MTRRSRTVAWGGVAALIVAGVLCGALVDAGVGALLEVSLVGLGLVVLLSLVFLEVGLSEDRARAREAERGDQRPKARGLTDNRTHHSPHGLGAHSEPPAVPRAGRPDGSPARRPAVLGRSRGRRRRLR